MKTELLSQPLAVDEDEAEPDTELQAALARARRLRQAETAQEAHYKLPKVTDTTMFYFTTSYLNNLPFMYTYYIIQVIYVLHLTHVTV